jgi:hypothetical protein
MSGSAVVRVTGVAAGLSDLAGSGALAGSTALAASGALAVAAALADLEAEFPGYEFSTQQTWEGVSLIAVRQDGSARPGLYAVITADLDEMRRALAEGEQAQAGALGLRRVR